jgi:hypothetical protein
VTCSSRTQTLSSVPTPLDLKGYAGDPLLRRFHFRDKVTHEPLPVVGDWAAQIRRSARDVEVLAAFAVDETDETTGTVIISLSGVQTAALPTNVGLVWDLQFVGDNGQPRTFFYGDLCMIQDVTR